MLMQMVIEKIISVQSQEYSAECVQHYYYNDAFTDDMCTFMYVTTFNRVEHKSLCCVF